MSIKRGIIFNLDGTLWDSTVQITEVWHMFKHFYKAQI